MAYLLRVELASGEVGFTDIMDEPTAKPGDVVPAMPRTGRAARVRVLGIEYGALPTIGPI